MKTFIERIKSKTKKKEKKRIKINPSGWVHTKKWHIDVLFVDIGYKISTRTYSSYGDVVKGV